MLHLFRRQRNIRHHTLSRDHSTEETDCDADITALRQKLHSDKLPTNESCDVEKNTTNSDTSRLRWESNL